MEHPEEINGEEIRQMRQAFLDLKNEIKELRVCVVGDRLKNIPGLMDILEIHRRELYGSEDTHDRGLKNDHQSLEKRVKSLEEDKIRLMAMCAAIGFLFSMVWQILKTFVFK